MKLKSLILGSVAAAGLSTAGFAADLGVLTSLDVCDELGLSGLTISSDTNCLQISGEVKYEFNWGNYRDNGTPIAEVEGVDSVSFDGDTDIAGISNNDWESRVQSWLKFVGTAGSDFGPASAVIKIKHDDRPRVRNGGFGVDGVLGDPDGAGPLVSDDGVAQIEIGSEIEIDEAYVQVGDTTVLTAGKRGSIFNEGDDEPFNFTGLFGAEIADAGVLNDEGMDDYAPIRGGHVIQLWTNIGEGLIAKIGLENLGGDGDAIIDAQRSGTLVGVLDYAGSGVTAHLSGAYGGLLDGETTAGDTYIVHTGATATFDNFKVRAAGSFGGYYVPGTDDWNNYWNVLASGEATFDMFKVALSAEAVDGPENDDDADIGFGGSIGATVAEGIELNLGGRYWNDGTDGVGDGYQVALQVIAAVTETIKLTGEIGVYGHGEDTVATVRPIGGSDSDFYASASLGWNPGGGFSSSLGAKVQENGAYKVTFKAAKSFQ
nr:hypothetical protein [uncultured Devosia sp.]